MEIGVDEHVGASPAPHGTPGLAHLQRGFQEPPGKGPAELFPFGGKIVAPLLRPCGDVNELPPLCPAVRNNAELPHEPAPHVGGNVHWFGLERLFSIQPFKQHRARAGVRGEQPDGSPPVPESQCMPFHQGFIVGESHFQGRRNPLGQHRHHDPAVAAPRQGAGLQINVEIPLFDAAVHQPGEGSQPRPAGTAAGVSARKIRRYGKGSCAAHQPHRS